MKVSYRTTEDPTGVVIKDHIKQRQIQVVTDSGVTIQSSDTESFRYPVDEAFNIQASKLSLRQSPEVYLRSSDGTYDKAVRTHETLSLGSRRYSLDFTAPVKIYWHFDGAATISKGIDTLQVMFPEPTTVHFGIRSYHKQPAGTITTTGCPDDLMTALSTLSSSLKTTSCERSYPTLRGYPPMVKLGDELDIPSGFQQPDTGIKFVVPPEHEFIYSAAPLAFYLGADLVPGRTPRLVTDQFEYSLDTDRWFEDEVAEVLKQVLFLDCVVRTEGLYQVDLHERTQVEPDLPFDIEEMYDRSVSEQLPSYLEVPFETVEPHLPRWCLTAHLPPTPDSVEAIPHIVNDLGVIRAPRANEHQITRNVEQAQTRAPAVRSEARSTDENARTMTLVEPVRKDESVEHAWFGAGTPLGASKASVKSFEHQLREIERNDSIDITVVCNDPHMIDEQTTLDGVYGDRDDHPYNVDSHFGVSREQLSEILTDDRCDLLHYIGHATPTGLRCTDGELDIRTLDSISVNAFLLNACRSFEQAEALVEKGSFGGVATLGDVVNEHAIEIGQAIAHLLNLGFPLRATVELVHKHTSIGDQYLIVGDGSLDIVQPDAGAPMVSRVSPAPKDDQFELTVDLFPTKLYQLGSTMTPYLDHVEEHFLHPGSLPAFDISKEQLTEYLTWTMYPFEMQGSINWNNSIGVVLFEE